MQTIGSSQLTEYHFNLVTNGDVADIDIDKATRAMFEYDLEGTAEILFADTVERREYENALPQRSGT
ncbi:MAG: hypothetical protein IH940_04560 [Acidobacteria bacterium]|nr:hypothetical protein [Acidobacteriota bacterium]